MIIKRKLFGSFQRLFTQPKYFKLQNIVFPLLFVRRMYTRYSFIRFSRTFIFDRVMYFAIFSSYDNPKPNELVNVKNNCS